MSYTPIGMTTVIEQHSDLTEAPLPEIKPEAKPNPSKDVPARQWLNFFRRGSQETEPTSPQSEPKAPEQDKNWSRRGFGKAIGTGVAAVIAATAIGHDVHPSALKEILTSPNNRIDFILANHVLPGEYDKKTQLYQKYGWDRYAHNYSYWDASGQEALLASLEHSKQQNRPYILMLDGISASNPPTWLDLPHALDPEKRPKEIIVVGQDPFGADFGLDNLAAELPNTLSDLFNDLVDRYGQPDTKGIIKDVLKLAPKAIGEKTNEGALAVAALASAMRRNNTLTRRRLLVTTGAVAAIETGKTLAQSNLLSSAAGELASPTQQRALIAAENMTGWTIADEPKKLYADARTALAIERAIPFTHHPPAQIDGQPQIGMLYGSFHADQLPNMMKSQSLRHTLIANYLKDLVGFIDTTVRTKYPNLINHLDGILMATTTEIAVSALYRVNMPTGITAIPPQEVKGFQKQLITFLSAENNKQLEAMANKVVYDYQSQQK